MYDDCVDFEEEGDLDIWDTNVKRVGHGDSSTVTTAREGNDNSYKMFMEERMQTNKVLKEAVDTM